MEIRTFTNFWNMEKKVYSIYDLQLPVAVPIRSIGVFAAIGFPYWLILYIFGVELALNVFIIAIWILPPAFAAFFSNKPIFQGKNVVDFVKSQFTFLMEAKTYKGLAPATETYNTNDFYEEKFFTMPSREEELSQK